MNSWPSRDLTRCTSPPRTICTSRWSRRRSRPASTSSARNRWRWTRPRAEHLLDLAEEGRDRPRDQLQLPLLPALPAGASAGPGRRPGHVTRSTAATCRIGCSRRPIGTGGWSPSSAAICAQFPTSARTGSISPGFIAGQDVTERLRRLRDLSPVRKKPLSPLETFAGKELNPDEYEEREIKTEDYASILLHFDGGAQGVLRSRKSRPDAKTTTPSRSTAPIRRSHGTRNGSRNSGSGRRDTPSERLAERPVPDGSGGAALRGGSGRSRRRIPRHLQDALFAGLRRDRSRRTARPTRLPDLRRWPLRAKRLGDQECCKARGERRWVTV